MDNGMFAGSATDGEEITREQAESMLAIYRKTLEDLGYDPVPFPDLDDKMSGNIYGPRKYEALCHARWMCDETDRFVREGRYAKAYRWIGMIQGLLFMGGVTSLADLKRDNRRAP